MEQIDQIRNDLSETTQIMKKNIQHLLLREQNLQELQEKAQHLEQSSNRFKQSSSTLKRKLWWVKNKTRLLIGSITVGTVATAAVIILI